ncbi:Cytokine receptor-like factor 2 [Acipenser ruthenus]|uniref:Cytokine receptor-like factor 2 n=1 Tax=Acipenser ruthenus TaxID=7906 RepID=A0A444TWM2_ACIRT|nr:Cytokine receptor-like factor 2 [Acipenser ruthenus]
MLINVSGVDFYSAPRFRFNPYKIAINDKSPDPTVPLVVIAVVVSALFLILLKWKGPKILLKLFPPIPSPTNKIKQWLEKEDIIQNITGNNMYSVTIPKSDNEKCHFFRVRMKWNDVCDSGSDWNSCHDNPTKNERILSSTNPNAPFLIIVLMAAIAMLLYCTYKTKRLRQLLIPEIPDPKHVFDDLFSYYDGNLQVWLDAFEASNDEFKLMECKHICIVEVQPEQEQEVEETMINYAIICNPKTKQ